MRGLSILLEMGTQIEGCFDEFMHTGILGVVTAIVNLTILDDAAVSLSDQILANKLTVVYPFTSKQGNLQTLGTEICENLHLKNRKTTHRLAPQ